MAKKSFVLDFTDVDTFVKVPEGTFSARVKDVEEANFQSGSEGFKVKFEITSGIAKGGIVYNNYPIMDTTLWKIKELLVCLGFKVPDGKFKLDLAKMVGKMCTIDIILEEYNGKDQPRVNAIYAYSPLTDEEDEDDDDEEVEEPKPAAKKTKKSSKKKKAPEPEEEDDDDDIEEVEAEEIPGLDTEAEFLPQNADDEEEDDDDWDDDDED